MSRRKFGREVHGVVLLDKPAGWSSNRALQKVRGLFNARKAGHTGSLDPFATGMLPVCLGEACKTAAFVLNADKEYHASARLGLATSTGDPEGEVIEEHAVPALSPSQVEDSLAQFRGDIEQIPPMYSALKHAGQPLYKLARKGVRIEREPRRVHVHELELLDWVPPMLDFRVRCSKGTYIRTLAEDLAKSLGTCAHLVALRRLRVEPFDPGRMVSLPELEAAAASGDLHGCLLPVDAGLRAWPVLELTTAAARSFRHGMPQETGGSTTGMVRVYAVGGDLLGLGEVAAGGLLKPRRVFNIQPLDKRAGMPGKEGTGRPELPEK